LYYNLKVIKVLKLILKQKTISEMLIMILSIALALTKERLFQKWVKKVKGVFVDVGANIGFYTEMASKKASFVLAFEPNPKVFAILRKRFEGKNNVACSNYALGNFNGFSKLYVTINDRDIFDINGSSSLVVNYKLGSYDVQVKRMDDLDVINSMKIDMIKIDVEGFEVEVLKGAEETIKRNKPVLLIECHGLKIFKEVSNIMSRIGYKLKDITYKTHYGVFGCGVFTVWIHT